MIWEVWHSCSSFLPCLIFQIVLVIYTKYNIKSVVFPSILLSMRYNHLSGIAIRHFAALDCFAKSYNDQGCVIHYHSVCIWLFIFCICTLLNNVMQLWLYCWVKHGFCDKDGGQFDFHVGKRWQVSFLALTWDK